MEIPGYDIERQIGQGGMATAYLAEQRSLGRKVVLKVLDQKVRDTPETVERFLNEGRIIAELNHPHIITIYDIGQSGNDVYISMEYVEGGDLKQRLQKRVFAPIEACDVVEKIASGLSVAHEHGIIHRDVKPGNILFRADGTPLLSDFGIAKRLSNDSDLTSTGMFLGSPNYMAPEQSEAGPIDGRADIYSLGVIFYEMVSGERAYTAESVIDVIVMHKKAPIPTLPEGLEQFQELLNLMMAKNRRERFRDTASLLHFMKEMRKSGAVQSKSDMTAHPDIDVTGEHEKPDVREFTTSTRIRLEPRKEVSKRTKFAMVGGLLFCAIVWGGLLMVERSMEYVPPPRAEIPMSLDVVEVGVQDSAGAAGEVSSERDEVGGALLWLGQHSLDEFRLVAPPKDNAYYYFTRLLQLEPEHVEAQTGLKKIAERFAFLAERELAEGRAAEAVGYIGMGLKIDPGNVALQSLHELAGQRRAGFWRTLTSVFK